MISNDLLISLLVAVRDSRLLWDTLGPVYNRRIRKPISGLYDHVALEMAQNRYDQILDVGSGRGYGAIAISKNSPLSRITGIDYSPMQVRAARKYAAKNKVTNCLFHKGNAMSIPYPDQTFDAAVSIGSIKHWPSPSRGLREIYRVLKQGGCFTVSETDRDVSDQELEEFISRFQVWFLPDRLLLWGLRHVIFGQSFSEKELAEMVAQAGFTDLQSTRVGQCPYVLIQAHK
ncbi:MAG: methyltransferase domain-containing protein [Smithellaceae bacterium]|jgi:ubiquinone/menaquinone biosynthesis C-methylase UbiE|nr:methyltransferase domain-containing protein [Syntrophaceae bacterium]